LAKLQQVKSGAFLGHSEEYLAYLSAINISDWAKNNWIIL